MIENGLEKNQCPKQLVCSIYFYPLPIGLFSEAHLWFEFYTNCQRIWFFCFEEQSN